MAVFRMPIMWIFSTFNLTAATSITVIASTLAWPANKSWPGNSGAGHHGAKMMNRATRNDQMMKNTMKILPGAVRVLFVVLLFAGICWAQAEYTQTPSGLRYRDLEVGSGETAETGKVAVIHFKAWLDDNGVKGAKFFDTRKQRGEPVAFKIGTDKVMPGWNIGVAGMKKGGKRRLMIPAVLGYGTKGAGEAVPPNADLIFDVELVDVR